MPIEHSVAALGRTISFRSIGSAGLSRPAGVRLSRSVHVWPLDGPVFLCVATPARDRRLGLPLSRPRVRRPAGRVFPGRTPHPHRHGRQRHRAGFDYSDNEMGQVRCMIADTVNFFRR